MTDKQGESLATEGLDADLLTGEQRAKLEAEHGEILAVKTRSGVAVFRVFSRQEYQAYNAQLIDEKKRAGAFSALVNTCVVQPSKEEFTRWLDKYPGIVTTCINPLLEFGGFSTEAATKKYGSA